MDMADKIAYDILMQCKQKIIRENERILYLKIDKILRSDVIISRILTDIRRSNIDERK